MSEEIHAFVDDQDVKTIRAPFFKDGEEVVIRKFSYGARQALAGAYIKVKADWGSEEARERKATPAKAGRRRKRRDRAKVEGEFLLGEMNIAILDRGIKSWILFDRKGKEVRLSKRTIADLTEPYAEYILEEINDFNPTAESEEEDEEEDEEFFRGVEGGAEG